MDKLMLFEMSNGGEGLAAHVAHEGLAAAVDQQMLLEVSLGEERLAAQLALVVLFPSVDHLVLLQAGPVGVALIAHITYAWLVFRRMCLKLYSRQKGPTTFFALVNLSAASISWFRLVLLYYILGCFCHRTVRFRVGPCPIAVFIIHICISAVIQIIIDNGTTGQWFILYLDIVDGFNRFC